MLGRIFLAFLRCLFCKSEKAFAFRKWHFAIADVFLRKRHNKCGMAIATLFGNNCKEVGYEKR